MWNSIEKFATGHLYGARLDYYAAAVWEISPDETGPRSSAEIEANMEVSFTLKFSRLISLLFFQTFEGVTYFLVSLR